MQTPPVTSMNMCWPVLTPQISGGVVWPGLVMVRLSVAHFPSAGPMLATEF